MKKITVLAQILVFIFFALKIVSWSGVTQNPLPAKAETPSMKSQTQAVSPKAAPLPLKQDQKDPHEVTQTLITALQERQKALDKREALLKTEEQRLLALKTEILEKMASLKAHQEKLDAELEKAAAVDAKRYKDLAKVFDSTPAAKAGAMLEVMDLKTAAGITMHMKKEKAGALWGHLTPQKAVEITREITRADKQGP